MKQIIATAAFAAAAFGWVGSAMSQDDRALGPYAPLIRENLKHQFVQCKHMAPDGGPACRQIKIVNVKSLPETDDDKLNGTISKKILTISFVLYDDNWTQIPNALVGVIETKSGWRLSTWND